MRRGMTGRGPGDNQRWKLDSKPVDTALLPGTEEQEAVWDALLNTEKNVIVEAVAGSGKTWTLVQYALREKYKRIGLVAFNKHIADELKAKVQRNNVECMTYHSLGFKAVRNGVRGGVKVDEYKVLAYLDTVQLGLKGRKLDRDEEKVAKYRVRALVGYAKNYGMDQDVTRDQLEWLTDRHDVDLNGLKEPVFSQVGPTLDWCKRNTSTIDYDDMVWLPYVLNLPVPQYDVLCVDEYQDTAVTQQWLALQSGKRVCAVGDSRQAIYAFRGADSKGFDRLREKLGDDVITLPLTLTRRCPQNHVRLAQSIVPQIRALENAPAGIVRYASKEQAVAEMRAGDLVVCRVNAELLGVAYALLKKGTRAVVRGRDLGTGLTKLVEQAEKQLGPASVSSHSIMDVLEAAHLITQQQISKFNAIPNGKGEMRAQSAADKYDCLSELGGQVENARELKQLLGRLFDDESTVGCVVLGTVHRTKGLEGDRVYVLRPDLMPHPMAKKPADREQERNLAYVAVTRSKFTDESKPGELVFVGGESGLFNTLFPMPPVTVGSEV